MGKKQDDSLSRRKPFREPRKLILIVCGGHVSEPDYFNAIREKHKDRLIRLEIAPERCAPLALVRKAIALRNRAAQMAQDAFDHFDAVWCVFDKDQFDLLSAEQLALAQGVKIAVSNPCFELWLVLHFQEQTGHVSVGQIQRMCKKYLPGYNKKVNIEKLWPNHQAAMGRA